MKVNISEGLAGRRQMGHHSINLSQEFSEGPPALMVGVKASVMGALREVEIMQGYMWLCHDVKGSFHPGAHK